MKTTPRKKSVTGLLRDLELVLRRWETEAVAAQKSILRQLASQPFGNTKSVIAYHEALLFLIAYAADEEVMADAEKEMRRLTRHVEEVTREGKERNAFFNSGIAGSEACSIFSLTLNHWLVAEYRDRTELYNDDFQSDKLMQLLNTTLDPVEQEMMHSEKLEWSWWSQLMSGAGEDRKRMLRWILAQLRETRVGASSTGDMLFTEMEIFTSWKMKASDPSLSSARIKQVPAFFHRQGILKRITLEEALQQGQPKKIALSRLAQKQLVTLSRGALASLLRETDPVTYAHVEETELFDMGRGVSIALFYMDAEHKMALQSYVGYLLFKNGVPCAYGGGWVVNHEAGFGVNIFPPFRGGESANIVCQLLRLYALHFDVHSFTVDPYQIGYGNPDGIKSGSFWFYYRLGFRPLEKDLARLAEKEFKKIVADKAYRSPVKVLHELSGSTLRWRDPARPEPVRFTPDAMGDLVSQFVSQNYLGDRVAARKVASGLMLSLTGMKKIPPVVEPILILALACGFLEAADSATLQKFADTYTLKYRDEQAYILGMQKVQLFFEKLRDAEKSVHI